MKRLAVLVALVLTAAASAAVPPDGNDLNLTGVLRTSSAKVVDTSGGCGIRNGTFGFQSGAMRLGTGPRVARVLIEIRQFHGRDAYNATTRPVRGWAPVQAITARNAATGAGSRRFYARRGGVTAIRASYSNGRLASADGTVGAFLTEGGGRLGHGNPEVGLHGSWHCRIER